MPPRLELLSMTPITLKRPMDDVDTSPINKKPKRDKIIIMAENMHNSIQAMRQTIEERYSVKMKKSNFILNVWHYACTKGANQEGWTSNKYKLLNERLPQDAYLSLDFNTMFEAFCLKPHDGVEEAKHVLKSIPEMRQMITDAYDSEKEIYMEILHRWMLVCEAVSKSHPVLQPDLDLRLPNLDLGFDLYNNDYQTFVNFVQLQVKSLPSPSDFGKDSRWGEEQRKEGRIYCFRPPETRSLPLCILHHIFRQYLLDIEQPLSLASDTAITAQIIAAKLCAKMGKCVSNTSTTAHSSRDDKENKRTKEFDACVSDFLGKVEPMHNLSSPRDAQGGIADGVILMNDIIIALREMKVEPGASGDAYMQVARCYDLAVKVLLDNPKAKDFVREGAPMFLICVIGPVIDISGGFYDGEKVIVEPLTDFRRMFEDALHVRQNRVARVLYALRKGIDKLAQNKRLQPQSPWSPPSTPRIYSTCALYSRHHQPNTPLEPVFKFQQMRMPDLLLEHNSLLFIGTLSGVGSVFVKLAQKYGENVHQLLEKDNLAPKLYAKSEVEGAPTAYIMEYLEPSSWKTLHSFATDILKILRENNKVHGDLRSVNVMVQVSVTGELACVDDDESQRASIKIIDFDWSGETREVHYPQTRNEGIQGITWPGKPGYTIEQDHDEQLFESWWPNVGKEVKDESSLQSHVSEA
ncbi:hypothetical protein APHAL10511_002937 [Amanita phalloides]|nr:hypothetical protein APHAL10511_002937 [Amanita phalloides]